MNDAERPLRTRALIAAGKQVAHARGEDGTWRLEVFVDAVLAITEADKAEAVAHERRRVVAEAHRALVSPWTRDPGAGPRYVMATCLRDFDRLMELLPVVQPSRLAAETNPEAANLVSAGRCGDCGHPWKEHLRDLGIDGYVPQGCTWPSCRCTEPRAAGR